MSAGLIAVLLIIAAALYFIALVGYRLMISLKSLKVEQSKLQANIDQLNQPIEISFEKAVPSSTRAVGEVLRDRERVLKSGEQRREQRRRRLIQRLQTNDLDKR